MTATNALKVFKQLLDHTYGVTSTTSSFDVLEGIGSILDGLRLVAENFTAFFISLKDDVAGAQIMRGGSTTVEDEGSIVSHYERALVLLRLTRDLTISLADAVLGNEVGANTGTRVEVILDRTRFSTLSLCFSYYLLALTSVRSTVSMLSAPKE